MSRLCFPFGLRIIEGSDQFLFAYFRVVRDFRGFLSWTGGLVDSWLQPCDAGGLTWHEMCLAIIRQWRPIVSSIAHEGYS
jgi:hypothetical protein